jgi:hypothetical protein
MLKPLVALTTSWMLAGRRKKQAFFQPELSDSAEYPGILCTVGGEKGKLGPLGVGKFVNHRGHRGAQRVLGVLLRLRLLGRIAGALDHGEARVLGKFRIAGGKLTQIKRGPAIVFYASHMDTCGAEANLAGGGIVGSGPHWILPCEGSEEVAVSTSTCRWREGFSFVG